MNWLAVAPAFGIALLLVLVPGVLLGVSLGLRGFAALAAAPALSVSCVVVASTGAPLVGLRWGLPPFLALTAVACVVVWAVRRVGFSGALLGRLNGPPARKPLARSVWTAAGVLAAALLIGGSLVSVFGEPANISQTFDNVFHLNALRYIADTGNASSLSVGRLTGEPFYPAGWHALVSLVGETSGVSIPISVNVTNVVIGALVWPLGIVFLVHQTVSRSALATITAAVLSASFAAFPLLMLDFGVLYPNYLALALLPLCVGVLATALGVGQGRVADGLHFGSFVVLGFALLGASVAHPNAFMSVLVFGLPMITVALIHSLRRSAAHVVRSRIMWIGAYALYLVVGFLLWKYVRPDPSAGLWQPFESVPQAIGQVLAVSPLGMGVAWLTVLLMILGLFEVASRRSMRAALWTFLVCALLFIAASSFADGRIRSFIVGVWYNDNFRLAALLPLGAIPVVVAGVLRAHRLMISSVVRISNVAHRRAARAWALSRRRYIAISVSSAIVLVGVLLAFGSHTYQYPREEANAQSLYTLTNDSPLLSSDELELLDRIDREVPASAVLAGNPWTGTALAYAFADRRTIQPHILAPTGPLIDAVNRGLRNAPKDSEACAAIHALHVTYVLDFGMREVHNGHHAYLGLEQLSTSPAVELVDQQGDAKLYRVTVCQ